MWPDNHARGTGIVEALAELALRGLTVDGRGTIVVYMVSIIGEMRP